MSRPSDVIWCIIQHLHRVSLCEWTLVWFVFVCTHCLLCFLVPLIHPIPSFGTISSFYRTRARHEFRCSGSCVSGDDFSCHFLALLRVAVQLFLPWFSSEISPRSNLFWRRAISKTMAKRLYLCSIMSINVHDNGNVFLCVNLHGSFACQPFVTPFVIFYCNLYGLVIFISAHKTKQHNKSSTMSDNASKLAVLGLLDRTPLLGDQRLKRPLWHNTLGLLTIKTFWSIFAIKAHCGTLIAAS